MRNGPLSSARSVVFAIAMAAALGPPVASGATWHVAASAPCPGLGSVLSPFCTIQAAIVAASNGDDILVQSGVYPEALDFLGKTLRLESVSGAASTMVGEPGSIPTVIQLTSGEVGVEIVGFRILTGSGTLTLTPFSTTQKTVGGGIRAIGATFELRDSIVDGVNLYHLGMGAGVYAEGGAVTISDSGFVGNLESDLGAGMCLVNVTLAIVRDNDIDARDAGSGVGMALWTCSSVEVLGNTIHGNGESSPFGGPQSGSGSGALIVSCNNALIRDNEWFGNEASGDGGALSISGDVSGLSALVEDNVFTGNYASTGGAVFCAGVDAVFRDNEFDGNGAFQGVALFTQASAFGSILVEDCEVRSNLSGNYLAGAIEAQGVGAAPIEIRRCVFTDNIYGVVAENGAAIVEDCVFAGNEVGFRMSNNSVARRSTFANNKYGAIDAVSGLLRVESCILHQDGLAPNQEIFLSGAPTLDVTDCIIEGGHAGTNVLNLNPQFVNPTLGDYRLQVTSPAVDAGLASDPNCGVDVAGLPRRVAAFGPVARVDMGAHEFSHVSLASTVVAPGMIKLDATGTAGLQTLLWVGFGSAEVCLPPAGTLLFDVSQPFLLIPWGPLPISLTTSVSGLPTGVVVRVQAMALIGASANLSGVVDIEG